MPLPTTRIRVHVGDGKDYASVETCDDPEKGPSCMCLNGMVFNTEPHPLEFLYLALREIFGKRYGDQDGQALRAP